MEQILELKHIHYAYHNMDGETPALTDISFAINEGEFIAIVGPSGCGKSTLLSLIAGLLEPEKGLIKISGKYLRAVSYTHLDVYKRQPYHRLRNLKCLISAVRL